MTAPMVINLYTRDGCHLCDQARAMLEGIAARRPGLKLREIDIDSDDRLLRVYLERIPVVEVGGELIGELVLDADEIRSRLDTVSA